MVKHFYSDRGIPLVAWRDSEWGSPKIPIVTVENYCKWYSLYVIYQDESVGKFPYEFLEKAAKPNETIMSDHVFNPAIVQRAAEAAGYELCTESLEMIIGRWEREVRETY